MTGAIGLLMCAQSSTLAAGAIVVSRGADREEFGNCVPSLKAENNSDETVAFLEVDLTLTLAGGQARTVELQSAYREGILFAIAPGGTTILKQHLDLSAALGAPCRDVTARAVVRTICEASSGKPCAAPVSVQP